MWIVWSVLVLVGAGLVIAQGRLLVREGVSGIAAPDGKWSADQISLLKVLRIAGCVGLVILWGALVYVLIDTGGAHVTQPWQSRTQVWGATWCLFYTSYLLGLLRTPNFGRPDAWRPSYRLAFQAFIIVAMFVTALAAIADSYFPPPAGSRPVVASSAPGLAATEILSNTLIAFRYDEQ
jgi:hypothetical protein